MFFFNDAITEKSAYEKGLPDWSTFTSNVSSKQRREILQAQQKREQERSQVYQEYAQKEFDKKLQEFFQAHAPHPIRSLSPLISKGSQPGYSCHPPICTEKRHRTLTVNQNLTSIRKDTSLDFPSIFYKRKDADAYGMGQVRSSLYVKKNHQIILPKASFSRHNFTHSHVHADCPPKCPEWIQKRDDLLGISEKTPWKPLMALDEIPYTRHASHTKTVLLDKKKRYGPSPTDAQVLQWIIDWDRRNRIKKFD